MILCLSLPSPSSFHQVSLGKECLFVRKSARISTYNCGKNTGKVSSFTIKCLNRTPFPATEVIEQYTRTAAGNNGVVKPQPIIDIKRSDFPSSFQFGCASSAIQTEGLVDEGGRGPGTWDSFVGEGKAAINSYNQYMDDVEALKEMGVDVYRLSISWSRILPDGTVSGGINQEGIDFYNRFLTALVENGITPLVTLNHFDLPQGLADKYRGFLDRQIVEDFKAYADICFRNFGDRVKYWSTINEPQVIAVYGYSMGLKDYVPKVQDHFIAGHNIILCHAAAAKLYQTTYQPSQKGEIGTSISAMWFKPATDTKLDKEASLRAFDFYTGWFLEPLIYGDYPFIMRALMGDDLPTFTAEEKKLVKGAYDFIGINYYTSRFAESLPIVSNEQINSYDEFKRVNTPAYIRRPVDKAATQVDGKVKLNVNIQSVEDDKIFIGPEAEGGQGIHVYPQGLKEVLLHITEMYNRPKLYITENGYPQSLPLEIRESITTWEEARKVTEAARPRFLEDDTRIHVLKSHMEQVKEAINSGAHVNGFFTWCLADCMEWGSYYGIRFGLYYTDYFNNYERVPKKSAKWFRDFLKSKSGAAVPTLPASKVGAGFYL